MSLYSIHLGDGSRRSDWYRLAGTCLAFVGSTSVAPIVAADAAVENLPYLRLSYQDALPSATLNSQQVVVMTTAEAELVAFASRSPLGRKLLELRRKVLATGIEPLDWEGVRAEVQADRNDL